MSIVTLDFETYYTDKDLGFNTQTTEEYVQDSRFEVIGVGVSVDDDPALWISGDMAELTFQLQNLVDWDNSALLCHNTLFDGAVLAWKFGIIPAFYFDTLCMARAIHGVDAGGSLKALAERYKIGVKGNEVVAAINKRRADFTNVELASYGRYCENDVKLTHDLFDILAKGFPEDELKLIDMTLRMFFDPVFEVDSALLVARLESLRSEKLELLGTLMKTMVCESEEAVRKKLASNKQFAEVLKSFGVTPPMKVSPTTKKPTLALAKTDEGFIALTEHDDVVIQELCAVRLGTKSTMEEKRIERFIDVGKRNGGKLPIPLKYYGAHTGRWSGMDKVNFQNLPSRDEAKKTLKKAVVAPTGYMVINCDSSQIEARVLAWVSGQDDVTQAFKDKRDVYCEFATKVFYRAVTKADPMERFVGKTCILGLGYGTGWRKLQHTLKTSPPGAALPDEECERIVRLYRDTNFNITAFWNECERALGALVNWNKDSKGFYLGKGKALFVDQKGIRLPNGLYITYPDLQVKDGGYVYRSRKGEVNIWGGTVTENVVQALARIVVGEQMIKIAKSYRVGLTVHDAAVALVPENEVLEAMNFMVEVMSTPPVWAQDLPVACEAKYAYSYGSC